MTQYQLTTSETQLILNQSRPSAQLLADISWIPRKQIPDALSVKDYELTRPPRPMGSKFGEATSMASVARSETTRNIMSYRYNLEFTKTEMAIAARNGYAMVAEANQEAIKQMTLAIAELFFQGSTYVEDRVDIPGAFDVGEDVDATLDAVYWDTATSPVLHCAAGFGDLMSNYYNPPYTMVCHHVLAPGMQGLYNAAHEVPHATLCKNMYGVERIVYLHGAAASASSDFGTGGYRILPLPAPTTDDGNWLMLKVSPENFFIAQVTNGIELSPMIFDQSTNRYTNYVEWRGTPVFRGATKGTAGSAEYIVFEPDVDLAS